MKLCRGRKNSFCRFLKEKRLFHRHLLKGMLWQFKCYQTEINVRIQGAAYSWMIQGEGSCCKRSVKPQDLVLGLFCSIPSWQPGYHCHAYNHAKGSSCTLSCSIRLALVPWLLLGHTSMTWDFVSQRQSSPALLPCHGR